MPPENTDLKRWYEENIETSSEEAISQELNRVREVFRDIGGEILPQTDESVIKQVGSLAVGKSVAYHADKSDSPQITLQETYRKIDAPKETVRNAIYRLKQKGFISSSEEASYEIVYPQLSNLLDYILEE